MNSGSVYINKLRINNFLSFYGRQEVDLKSFTGIICNYDEGKESFIRAIEFVLGSDILKDLKMASPKFLQHKVFWEEENDYETECYVEVTLESLHDEDSFKLYRGVKNGTFEYKLNDKPVSKFTYNGILNDWNINIIHKNIIFRNSFFYNVMWGNPDELETVITKTLRVNSMLYEWKNAKRRLEYLKEISQSHLYKAVPKMKQSQRTIEKFVDFYNDFQEKMDCFREKSRQELEEESAMSLSLSISDTDTDDSVQQHFDLPEELEKKQDELMEEYDNIRDEEIRLLSHFDEYVRKLSSKRDRFWFMQKRIKKLKQQMKNEENKLSSLWSEMQECSQCLAELGQKISTDMAALWDIQQSCNLRNKITLYGRFKDYFQPNNFTEMLRKILGDTIMESNLCDTTETAEVCIECLKSVKYEARESFIIFENYTSDLKDLLLGSGENGIKIKNIQELRILLCKFKEYKLISTVPIINRERFSFNLVEEYDYTLDTLYQEGGIFLTSDGLISYALEDGPTIETKESIIERIKQSLQVQELEHNKLKGLNFRRLKTLYTLYSLEDEILELKFRCQKIPVCEKSVELFQEYDEETDQSIRVVTQFEDMEQESQLQEHQTDTEIKKLLNNIFRDVDKIQGEKTKIEENLMKLEKKLDSLYIYSNKVWSPPVPMYVQMEATKSSAGHYYEHNMKKLTVLMSTDEIEEFMNSNKWRKGNIDTLSRSVNDEKKSLQNWQNEVYQLTGRRKDVLSPLLEHCSINLTSTFQFIMDTSLPLLNLGMAESEEGLQLCSSLPGTTINIVPIQHMNAFLKFVAALSLLLELSTYDKIPYLLLDDVNEFLPQLGDTFQAVLDEKSLERLVTSDDSIHYQILNRISQYLCHFIKKNQSRKSVRKNGKNGKNGPIQIIYFASGDLIHSANHVLWIRQQILPDELIQDDCDSYSVIDEISF